MTARALRTPLLLTAVGGAPKRSAELAEPHLVEDAVVAWDAGRITYAGATGEYDGAVTPEPVDGAIVPGFVDCHTHLPFFGWRADEFAARRAGRSYRDLHGDGGIYRSARMLGEASDDEIIGFCKPLLAEALAHGTTTVELKTGYGLSVEAELRQARLARRLADEAIQRCTVTLLAAHAVPHGLERETWVGLACEELIPRAAGEGLVDAVDVYVEDIAFDVEDLSAIAAAAMEAGLRVRCHVEQLSDRGGAAAAARLGAASADHLNHLDPAGAQTLAGSDTIAVLLPAATFVLGGDRPPARALIDAGAAVAVASDFNPGTSPVLSMPEVITLACTLYGLTSEEATVAATLNAACVLGLGDEVGSLEPGKAADLLVLEATPAHVPYRPGHNPVVTTFVAGRSQTG